MKKVLLSFCIVLFVCVVGYNQSLKIIDQGTIVVNGTSLYVNGTSSTSDISKNVWVQNVSGQTLDVKVTRKEITFVPGTLNATCWGICPPEDTAGVYPELVSSTTVTMADSAIEYSFSGHLYPERNSGCSHYRYIFFGVGTNIADSVDVFFSHGQNCATSVNPIENEISFDVFPNPATDKISLNLSENISKGEILITNVLGMVISRRNVSEFITNNEISLSGLANGFYFVTLVSDNKKLLTKRFQVLR
jgi:hypothetical protein